MLLISAVIASLQIYFWSNSKCLDDSWRPLLMSVSVAANGVLQFPLLIRCISFKWKFVKFTQSLISTIPRFLHNSTSIAHKVVNYKVHFGSKQAWYVPCWMKLRPNDVGGWRSTSTNFGLALFLYLRHTCWSVPISRSLTTEVSAELTVTLVRPEI